MYVFFNFIFVPPSVVFRTLTLKQLLQGTK
uniref:Uncharacterized protein n=1 Tax=Setaria viridis TaxID=4556 RepID=A0A4U6SQL9_SETVI|nr:hypothetical protein SEVIR_9G066160v2 [Setaria viridis]